MTDKLKKTALISEVADEAGLTQAVVRQVLDAAAVVIKSNLAAGRDAFLFGLGKLSVVHRGPRPARHMRTGERVIVPPRYVALYRPSSGLEAVINGRDDDQA